MDKASLDVISCDSVPSVGDACTERNEREYEDNEKPSGEGQIEESAIGDTADNGTVNGDVSMEINGRDHEENLKRSGGGQVEESVLGNSFDNGTFDGDVSMERNGAEYEGNVKRSGGGLIEESAADDAVDNGTIGGYSCRMVKEEDTSSSDESGDDSASESESESESSNSSSSSSSDDDDQREEKSDEKRNRGAKIQEIGAIGNGIGLDGVIDVEEGEIMGTDDMVAWSDDEEDANAADGEIMGIDELAGWFGDEDDGDDDGGVVPAGPIRSKNETEVLPPVPPVKDSLQPHHQTVPVGAVISILDAQVIVEGAEKHNPLDEGSILWINQTREPLGIVDEVFGPVKNPFYIIRYNSESEVPTGIEPGTSVCYVTEFANHVLENKSVYEKGYDASGANDEELLDDQEFTDDEKEAEYKKTLKLKKRGSNNPNLGSKKMPERKFNNRPANKKFDKAHSQQVPSGKANRQAGYSVQTVPPIPTLVDNSNAPYSCSPVQGLAVQPGVTAPFAQLRLNSPGAYGILLRPPGNMGLNGLPPSTMPFLQHPHMTMPNGLPMQHQSVTNACLPSNLAFHMGMSGFNAFAPIPGGLMGNSINPPYFQMGNPGQQPYFPAGIGGQAFAGNMQPSNGISGKPPPNFDQGKVEDSEPHQRGKGTGDGHFGGFRG